MVLDADYTWSETATVLKIVVPLHNFSSKEVDVITTTNFVKVSFGSWLLALDLFGEVGEGRGSKATIKNGVLTVKLVKKAKGIWGQLTIPNEKGRDWIEARRAEGMEEREKRVSEMHEKAKEKRVEEERMALKKQMALEQKERQDIEDLKEEEKQQAEEVSLQRMCKMNAFWPSCVIIRTKNRFAYCFYFFLYYLNFLSS